MKLTLTLAVVSAGAAGCAMDHLTRRASNELECDPARVNVLERHDIAYEVYDVEACGRRARYSCVGGGRGGVFGCVHEPDPPKWDPDPALAAYLPVPGASNPSGPPSIGARRRICGRREEECVAKQNGVWQWRPAAASISSSGCGVLCQ